MNETRVRSLAKVRQVEITKKMLKRFLQQKIDINRVIDSLEISELKEENVLSYPDYNYRMGIVKKDRKWDVIITQNADGRAIRIVGYIARKKK